MRRRCINNLDKIEQYTLELNNIGGEDIKVYADGQLVGSIRGGGMAKKYLHGSTLNTLKTLSYHYNKPRILPRASLGSLNQWLLSAPLSRHMQSRC